MQYPNRIIQEGEKNQQIVRAIQDRLEAAGCGTFVNRGIFGPKTKAAVRLFQSTRRDQFGNPLTMDGRVGAITWAILFGLELVPEQHQAPNSLLEAALRKAASQVGVMEQPPGENRGPQVDKYLASVGLGPGYYWCAAFVHWCFAEAASRLGRSNPLVRTGGCMHHWNNSRGKKITTTEAINKPSLIRPGQIFIISLGSGFGHTGIVEKLDGGFIQTIEGNSNTAGSANGLGVFRLERKIARINKGFIEYK